MACSFNVCRYLTLSKKGISIWKPAVNVALYFPNLSTIIAVLWGTILIIDIIRINPKKITPIRIKVVLDPSILFIF
jgi:hypothetical protein